MTDRTEIERLVESAYSGLHPSTEAEQDLMANLSRDRARPVRLMTVLLPIAALLLVGVALLIERGRGGAPNLAGEGQGDGRGPGLDLAVVARPPSGVVQPSTEEIDVQLLKGGRLQVLKKEWTQLSLDGLAAYLSGARKGHRIVLATDRDAPWLHVQWVMMVCAEQRRPDFAFAAQTPEGKELLLDASLPMDRGLEQRRKEIRVSILVRRAKGGRVRYSFTGRQGEELASVARWLAQAKKAAEPVEATLRGEIKALGDVPFHHVAKLLAEFRQAGYAKVDFSGTRIPDEATRKAKPLPAPGPRWPDDRFARALVFRVVEDDASAIERLVDSIHRRLQIAGYEDLAVAWDLDRLLVEPPKEGDAIEEIRKLVERKGSTLEFHLTLEPGDKGYEAHWQRFKRALDGGAKFEDIRDVEKSAEYPHGLRWYRLSERGRGTYAKERLPENKHPFVLCRNDDCRITRDSLENLSYRRNTEGFSGDYVVVFDIKKAHQASLARLTATVGEYMAIILDDEVDSAPIIQSSLSSSGQLSGSFSKADASLLAALLGSEPLPVRLKLVER